jgi:hypothetical protein
MKIRLPGAALCLLSCIAATAAFAIDYPARKPGLWEMKIGDGTAAAADQTIQQCIDASSDQAMRDMAQGMGTGKDACSKQDMRKAGSTTVIDSVCKVGTSIATTHAVVTGDLSTGYRMESTSTYQPPFMGKTEGKAAMDAKWVGPCKADQKPGDMIMSNGMKMNVLEMVGKKK